jgi:arabinofuranan 3-O-arabinosyltransferase
MTAKPVAIVVPTKNSSRTLKACLSSIRAQTLDTELIVVDNHSTDETQEIAHVYADQLIVAGPERSAQRNIGMKATQAGVVGFIDSDMTLSPNVSEQAYNVIATGHLAVVVPEITVGSGYWTAVRAFERSLYVGNENVEAARFFDRPQLAQLGGFNEALTGGEDWDLDIRVRARGTVGRIDAPIEHDEGEVKFLDACKKKAYYATGYSSFLAEHGKSKMLKIALDRPYIRSPQLLFNALGAGLIALKVGEAVAMTSALIAQKLKQGTQ